MTSKIKTVTLPDLGEGVVEGEVVEWLKQTGDSLSQDEPVVLVMTDKASVELPALHPGILKTIHVQKGEIARKDHPLYDIELSGEIEQPAEPAPSIKQTTSDADNREAKQAPKQNTGKSLATPSTRRIAREMKIDINQVTGTGKGGRVTKDDLEKFKNNPADKTTSRTTSLPAVKPPERFEGDKVTPLRGIRRATANAMQASKAHIPHFSCFDEADATRLVELRRQLKEMDKEQNFTYTPLFAKALSMTMQQFPDINASLDTQTEEIIIHSPHNIGIAVATEHGLVVPVVKDVQNKDIKELSSEINSLVNKARANRLTPEDLRHSTITITNIGSLGGLFATPVIPLPNAAILGLNRIQKRPAVDEHEELCVRDTLCLSWSFDHRLIDGELAIRCNNYFKELIQHPMKLLVQ